MCCRAPIFLGFVTFESTFHSFIEQERMARNMGDETFKSCRCPDEGEKFESCIKPWRQGSSKFRDWTRAPKSNGTSTADNDSDDEELSAKERAFASVPTDDHDDEIIDESETSVHIVTAASSLTASYCETILSVKFTKKMPTILAFGDSELRHGNHNRKLHWMLQYLGELPPHDIVVFMDAKDVNMNHWDEEEFLERFLAFKSDIVLSGEINCYPKGPWCKKEQQLGPPGAIQWYLNSGLFAGRARKLQRFIAVAQTEDAGEKNSDQRQFHLARKEMMHHMQISIDYYASLFLSLYRNGKKYMPSTAMGPDLKLNSGVRPFFVHGNAGSINKERDEVDLFQKPIPRSSELHAILENEKEPMTRRTFRELCCVGGSKGVWC